jgi:hypothetical protein
MSDAGQNAATAGDAAPDAGGSDFDSLPGVVEEGGSADLFDAPGGEDGNADPAPREGEEAFQGGDPPADAPPAEPPPGDPPPSQETPPADLPPANQPAGPVTFNGKEYPSWKAVEDEHKSVVGRLQAAGEEIREARTRANQYYQLYQQTQGGAGTPEPPQPGAEGGKPEAPPAFADLLDWDFVNEVLDSKGPMGAMFYMADEMGKFVEQQLSERIQQAIEPHQQLRQRVEMAQEATNLFNEAAATTVDEGGAQMYPELSNPDSRDAVLRIWQQVVNAMPREAAFSPIGVDYAVMKYRELAASNGNQSAPPANLSPEATGTAEALARASGSNGGLDGGGAPPRPATRSPEEQAARRVREAGKVDETFGFAP